MSVPVSYSSCICTFVSQEAFYLKLIKQNVVYLFYFLGQIVTRTGTIYKEAEQHRKYFGPRHLKTVPLTTHLLIGINHDSNKKRYGLP